MGLASSFPGISNGTDVLALVGLMSFLISGVVAVAAVWRSSRNSATLQNLKDATESYKVKTEAQDMTIADMRREHDGQVADLNAQLAAKDRELNDLRGRMTVLQDMVTGRSALEQLAGSFTAFAEAHQGEQRALLAAVTAVQQSVNALRDERTS